MYKILTKETSNQTSNTAILLAGRGQSAEDILSRYSLYAVDFTDTRLIAIEPFEEWYPAPNGANDQSEAYWGLQVSVVDFLNLMKTITEDYNIDYKDVVLIGYSAGGVMALNAAIDTENAFKAVVVHNGAILEPKELVAKTHETPILLIHTKDDDCFKWDERYLPMKTALIKQGYPVSFYENEDGGHFMRPNDINYASTWINNL